MLSDLQPVYVCTLQFRVLVGHIFWEYNFLPIFWPLTTPHANFSMPSTSIASIPNSAGLSPGTKESTSGDFIFVH